MGGEGCRGQSSRGREGTGERTLRCVIASGSSAHRRGIDQTEALPLACSLSLSLFLVIFLSSPSLSHFLSLSLCPFAGCAPPLSTPKPPVGGPHDPIPSPTSNSRTVVRALHTHSYTYVSSCPAVVALAGEPNVYVRTPTHTFGTPSNVVININGAAQYSPDPRPSPSSFILALYPEGPGCG